MLLLLLTCGCPLLQLWHTDKAAAESPMQGGNSAKCRACGSTEAPVYDSETGNTVCPSCGTLVEETQQLVSGEFWNTDWQGVTYGSGLVLPRGAKKGAEWHLEKHLVRELL